MGGVIVVDAGRSRSTCLGRDAYIHDHCHESVIIICFFINCPTVICLPTVCFALEREVSSENYGPRVYLYHILKFKNTLLQFYLFYLVLLSSNLLYLSLLDLTFASDQEGIDNPFIALGASVCFCVCRCCYRDFVWFSYWIDNLGS
jgi:hypothetical protein